MKFGDVVYEADIKSNAFARKKIWTVDSEGIHWFRYDKEQWAYEINELTYCGDAVLTIRGDTLPDEELLNTFYFRYPDGKIVGESLPSDLTVEDIFDESLNWFRTREEAEQLIANHKSKMEPRE